MGGRVVEGGSLENYCTFTRTLGSNPSPSALKKPRYAKLHNVVFSFF